MIADQHHSEQSKPWYQGTGKAVRRFGGMVLVFLLTTYFVFCGLFLGVRYVVLPNIDQYKDQIERISSRSLDRKVSIAAIEASWRGMRPHLILNDVVIYNREGGQALSLPQVAATVSWQSVATGELRLESLEIKQPDMEIERDQKGNLFVAGLLVERDKKDDGKGLDWLLSQKEVVIRDGTLRWKDGLRAAPELVLSKVDFVLRNQWRRHRMALKATPPAQLAAPIDVRADFVHPLFTRAVSDVSKWKGTLYADWRNTDLAVWKPYFDYPFEVSEGKGSIRAWLDMDHARVTNFTADLTLADVSARLRRDLQVLNLAQVSGRVSASEEAGKSELFSFGVKGHAVSLKDFSFETKDGLKLPATTVTQTFLPAAKNRPEKTKIYAQSVDLHPVANFAGHLPLTLAQRQMLSDFSPRGQLKEFSAEWQGAYPNVSAYKIKGEFLNLSLNAQAPRPAILKRGKLPAQAAIPGIPGFNNLSGRIDAGEQGGVFNLNSTDLRLDLPGYFADPVMFFDKLDMQAKWDLKDQAQVRFYVDDMDFIQDGVAGSLSGTHTMPLAGKRDKGLGVLDLSAELSVLELNKIGRYLPLNTPDSLRTWLARAFEKGQAKNLNVTIKGDIADFPFHREKPSSKPKGVFTVAGDIEQARLNYTPGHFGKDGASPYWPVLDDINGSISLDGAYLRIFADKAQTHGVALSEIDVVIPNLISSDSMLEINGSATGALQDFVNYANASPVTEWIAGFTEEIQATGNAKLGLKIQLPLQRMLDTKVQGTLQFAGNNLILQGVMPPLSAAHGELKFHEKGFSLHGLRANFVGGPVIINGGTQRDGTTLVKADGIVSSEGLHKAYQSPAMQRLAKQIVGNARYAATINIRNQRPEILVESNLQGVALDFPAPLRKAANESLPLRVELKGLPARDAATTRDEIKVSLGNSITARYLREKVLSHDAFWKVVRGGIGINAPAPEPDSGLIANVNLRTLDIDAWRNAVAKISGSDEAAQETSGSSGFGIAQYIEPDMLAARATELVVMGKRLNNVVVGASQQNETWQANIDSEQVSGYVTWNESSAGAGLGRVTARLASLIIPESVASDVTELLEASANQATQIPNLDITAENFQLFGKKFGELELVAQNTGGARGREWRIGKLSIVNPDGNFKASGKWTPGKDSATSLSYTLDIADAGRLLDRMGFEKMLRGGKGKMSGDINWKGLPYSLDIPTLSGQMKIDLAAGQFLRVEPGVAKLLGVLSLQSLPRRLALDFRDVFSEGFSFDSVVSTATLTQGTLDTDTFKMRGVNAVVLMDGTVDIVKEQQNLHVVVIPEINAGAASVVYGLVVNPMIGLGSFLAQLFLRDPLMRALTMEYQITGPWKDPAINKIPRNAGSMNLSDPQLSSQQRVGDDNG